MPKHFPQSVIELICNAFCICNVVQKCRFDVVTRDLFVDGILYYVLFGNFLHIFLFSHCTTTWLLNPARVQAICISGKLLSVFGFVLQCLFHQYSTIE